MSLGKFISQKIQSLNNHGFLYWMPDKMNIKLMFRIYLGRKLDLNNPKTFNEKLQWIKLYDRKPIYTVLADKYAVRKLVANVIGEEYLIPLLGVWKKAEDIDFDQLPKRFVLKCNHDSGSVIICKDKNDFDRKKAVSFLSKRLKANGCYHGREWPYKNIPRRIIAEQYMEDQSTQELRDYKFHCFGGKPKFVLVCSGRKSTEGLREDFFDTEWNHLDVRRPAHGNASFTIEKPKQLDQMLVLAEKLADQMAFSRIDFYVVNGKIYFGEITLFPTSGYTAFDPYEFDELFGSWIKLPCK